MQAISKLFIDKQDQIMQFYISHLTRNCLKKIPITKAVSIAWKLKINKNFFGEFDRRNILPKKKYFYTRASKIGSIVSKTSFLKC